MSVMQISVFLENKPGTLKKMTEVLAASKISMRATSLAETKDFGIARLVVDDAMEAVNTLKEHDFVASLTPVLAVEIPDETGGLDKLLSHFSEAGVNIEYMYAFPGRGNGGQAYMIFRVADTKNAEAKLAGKGLKLLTQEEIANI
ncbi:acetolactate synthase [Butyrivibrio proteoclasticus]|uniref:acetolactate synthase n=1 Tax=Butyrivibrio proteoclasticus TaxID=43305 RepID=UPI00047A15D8|nr:acetolactate synthase [Butyrivibrio proteoclasticus]